MSNIKSIIIYLSASERFKRDLEHDYSSCCQLLKRKPISKRAVTKNEISSTHANLHTNENVNTILLVIKNIRKCYNEQKAK